MDRPLRFLNLGSGIGVPYAEIDHPVDVATLGQQTCKLAKQLPQTQLCMETEMSITCNCGTYCTTVLDKKFSTEKPL